MKELAAFFDLDGTLLKGHTMIPWLFSRLLTSFEFAKIGKGIFVFTKYKINPNEYAKSVKDITNLYASWAKGKNVHNTMEAGKKRAQVEMEKYLYAFVVPLIKTLKELGIKTFLITGGPNEVVQGLDLDFDEVHALMLEKENGVFNGNIAGAPNSSEKKAELVENLKKKYDIILGAGNTGEDFPLLEAAVYRLFIGERDSEIPDILKDKDYWHHIPNPKDCGPKPTEIENLLKKITNYMKTYHNTLADERAL